MYEYEASTKCPECCENRTVPVAACFDEETGTGIVLAKEIVCRRHDTGRLCELGSPTGLVVEIRLKDIDAYQYMAYKIDRGYEVASVDR